GLGGTSPTYYALSFTRGLNLQLLRVVNAASTVIAQLSSATWFSDQWAKVTLYVNGNNLRAQVYRPDTAQFLAGSGQWQSAQAWAINVTDAAITQAGNVGLARPASYTGTVVFDDFSVQPAVGDTTRPTVAIVAPAGSAPLTGVVAVQASAQDTG